MQERTYLGTEGVVHGVQTPSALDALVGDFRRLAESRYVLANFVFTQLRIRYQRSALGFLWTLLHPVLMLGLLAVVFSRIMGEGLRDYALYLFSGMIPFQFFNGAITNASSALVRNESLVRKVRVFSLLFPLADVLVAVVNMALAMVAMFILFQFIGGRLHVQLVILPLAVILMTLFTFGMSLISMTLLIRFRDLEHIISVLLQAAYFITPILYRPQAVDIALVRWNPLTHLLALFQAALCVGEWPSAATWGFAVVASLGAVVVGYAVYKVNEDDFIFRL